MFFRVTTQPIGWLLAPVFHPQKEAKLSERPNEQNERIKRRFLEHRKHAGRLSDKSLDKELAILERFDVWNGRKDFARFHIKWPVDSGAKRNVCIEPYCERFSKFV